MRGEDWGRLLYWSGLKETDDDDDDDLINPY